jgi:hypothetical protein
LRDRAAAISDAAHYRKGECDGYREVTDSKEFCDRYVVYLVCESTSTLRNAGVGGSNPFRGTNKIKYLVKTSNSLTV